MEKGRILDQVAGATAKHERTDDDPAVGRCGTKHRGKCRRERRFRMKGEHAEG